MLSLKSSLLQAPVVRRSSALPSVPHHARASKEVRCPPICSLQQRTNFGVEEYIVSKVTRAEELEEDRRWVATQVQTWLDEEWTPLQVHSDLGRAAADAYCQLRTEGEQEMGDLLLGLSTLLMGFNFRETFTGPFEVSNKVVELLMMRTGCEVCCTSQADKERMDRVSSDLSGSDEERA